jgi:ATP-dependent helicase/DNAse subunit B
MYIRFIKKWLRDVVKTAILQKDPNISNITGEVAEKNVTFEVAGVQFTGQIDKIIYTKGASGQQYYTITDYKSGSSGTFELEKVFLGGSLQLPLYYLALQQKQNQEYTHNGTDHFGGFGIQHLYFANGIPTSDGVYGQKSISEKMRNAGIAYNDFDYAESFDSTAVKQTSKGKSLKKGEYRDFGCSFSADTEDSSLISKGRKYTLEEFIQDAIAGTKKNVEAIENSLFDIAPTATKTGKYSDEFCKYCPYKDVCYHAKADIRNIKSEMDKHFQLSEGSAGSDESDDDYGDDVEE